MAELLPPPLPPPPRAARQRRTRVIVTAIGATLASVSALIFVTLIILRALSLLKPFSIPTLVGMSPTINPGDNICMEGLTYLLAKPKRGDVVVFATDRVALLRPGSVYVKRLIGLPGDRLRLAKGILYLNDAPVSMRNQAGEIHYVAFPHARYLANDYDIVTVPPGQYFVLGDDSRNSSDSRFWGFLPAESVKGRAFLRCLPPGRFGWIQ